MLVRVGARVILFDEELRFGRAVGVSVAAAAGGTLPPTERALAASYGPARRATFVAGRVALRAALERAGLVTDDIGATPRGAPALEGGALGSISHKDDVAFGLASAGARVERALGVDVEKLEPLRVDIAPRILTERELVALERVPAPTRDRVVRVTFSVKEAIYKAIDPFVHRYVAFREVELGDVRAFATEGAMDVEVVQRLGSPSPRALAISAAYRVIELGEGVFVLSEARADAL